MPKIKEIPNALVDERKDELYQDDFDDGIVIGHNTCREAQGEVEITHDRERLAKRIWDTYYSKGQHPGGSALLWDKQDNNKRFWAYEQADAIIADPSLLVAVRKG